MKGDCQPSLYQAPHVSEPEPGVTTPGAPSLPLPRAGALRERRAVTPDTTWYLAAPGDITWAHVCDLQRSVGKEEGTSGKLFGILLTFYSLFLRWVICPCLMSDLCPCVSKLYLSKMQKGSLICPSFQSNSIFMIFSLEMCLTAKCCQCRWTVHTIVLRLQ